MSLALHYPFYQNASLTDLASGVALACTRATTRSMPDADGWIREVQANEAAFEGATFRHNLIRQSNDFDTTWSLTRATVAAKPSVTDPFGGTDTWALSEDGTAANTHRISQGMIPVTKPNRMIMYSVWAKAANRDYIAFTVETATGVRTAYFDLANGVTFGAHADFAGTGIVDAGNGWYRCYAWSLTSGSGQFRIDISETGTTTTFDGLTQESLYLYGAQVEDVSGRWDSENLCLESQTIGTTPWIDGGGDPQYTSGVTDPFGGTNAQLVTDGAVGGSGACSPRQDVTVPHPGHYILSVYLKQGSESWAALLDNGLVASYVAYFDLANGVIGTTTGSPWTSGIIDVGNGWYRCYMGIIANSTDVISRTRIYIAEADNDNVFAALDGSHNINMFGVMIERAKPNQTTPGTYAATTTAAVTNYSPSAYIATTTVAKSVLSGANDGLVDWESRTNIALQSEDWSTTWATTRGVINTNQTIAPDGSLTADQLIDDAATGTLSVYSSQSVTVATSTQYTYSVFAKADQLSIIALSAVTFTTPADSEAWFDLAAGSELTVDAGFDDSGIEDYGNGWYRCWVTFTTDGTDTTGVIRAHLSEADGAVNVDRDGTSSIFVWGAQLEVGSKPSPYIRTTTGTVTANADNIDTTDLSWLGTDEHTFYFHGQRGTPIPASGAYGFSLNNNAFTERFAMYGSADDFGALTTVTTGTDWSPAITSFNNLTSAAIRCVLAVAPNDGVVYTDGTQKATTSSLTVPSVGLATLDMGKRQDDTAHFNGLIKEFRYYDQRFSNDITGELSNGNFPSLSRRVKLVRDLTANLTRGLTRNLIN